MGYQPKVYRERGGKRMVVASGGELDVETGGALKLAGTSITATAAQVNKSALLATADRAVKVARIALVASDVAGGLFAWANPEGVAVLVERVLLDVTTKATGACTADVGVANDGTTLNDTLIDGVDVGTAAGLFDNVENKGTNGKARQRVGSTQFVTASVASGASAGIVGFAYVHYVVV